jgi:hypothetical protein
MSGVDSTLNQRHFARWRVYFFEIARDAILFLLMIYMKKLCSHVRKSHLEIKKIKKFEK